MDRADTRSSQLSDVSTYAVTPVIRIASRDNREIGGASRRRRDDVSRRHNIDMTCAEFVARGKSAYKRIRWYWNAENEEEGGGRGGGSIAWVSFLSIFRTMLEDAAIVHVNISHVPVYASFDKADPNPTCIPNETSSATLCRSFGSSNFIRFRHLTGVMRDRRWGIRQVWERIARLVVDDQFRDRYRISSNFVTRITLQDSWRAYFYACRRFGGLIQRLNVLFYFLHWKLLR